MKNPTNKLSRWAIELQSHSFDIEHKPGALNHVPDALSRMYEEPEQIKIGSVTWATSTEDEWYLKTYQAVEENPRDYPDWNILGNHLYVYKRNSSLGEILDDEEDVWKLVVPKEHRQTVLRECHDNPTSGHMGREKTYNRVTRYYYWPNYYDDVRLYVKNCIICQQTKVDQRAPAGLMGRRNIDRPWSTVAGDVTGPLPKTSKGFEYILIFQDLFTRWVECIPIRKANAITIIKEFNERVINRFGAPEVFLSDNGTEFKNKMVDEFLTEKGIQHTTTPIYHPQANPVERVNRTLKTMIVAYIEEKHKTWDEKVPELMFAINTAVQSSTGFSPAMLNYGRQPSPPKTLRREQDQLAQEQAEQEKVITWNERLKKLPELQAKAAENSQIAKSKQAFYYNANRREVSFEKGDQVWLKNRILSSAVQGISGKLAPKYSGPYMILEKLGSGTYKIMNADGIIEPIVHVQDLKPFSLDDDPESEMEDAQPPRESQEMSDPPIASDNTPDEENASVATRNRVNLASERDIVAPAVVKKRKRGRPSKKTVVVRRPAVKAKTTAKPRLQTSPKRKRGRPPGVKNLVDSNAIDGNVSESCDSSIGDRIEIRRSARIKKATRGNS